MANGAATYTTYLRTELDPVSRQSYSQLRSTAEATYRDIARFATLASDASAQVAGDRRAATGFRALENNAGGAFAAIRREASSATAAVSQMQARLATIRTTAIGGAVSGVSPSQISTTRAAAAANDNLSGTNARLAATTATVTNVQRRQQQVTRAVSDETNKLGRGLTVLGTTLSVVQGPLGPIAGRINAITSAVTTLGTGTLILAGAATALFAFAGVANVYAEVESRLKPLYTSQEQVNGALRETGRIALATRSALGPTADLYAKLTAAGREYNLSSRQVSRVTETAAKAATLSGGNEASRAAGLYQFSQGLSSGKLGGDELRSILENIPELARAIAQGFKNVDGSIGTTTGNLRKLGAEGALSTQVVVDALTRSAGIVDAKFSKLPKTISSARTEFITTFTILTGQIDHTIGVTSTLANVISAAAANMQILLALGGAMAARFILPKLGGFLAELTSGIRLAQQLQAQTNVAAGRLGGGTVTRLTPVGIGQAKVSTAAARVAEERAIVAAIDTEIAATKAAAEADREKARSAQANARFEVAATEQRIAALRAELAQQVENKAAASTNVANFARAAPLVTRAVAPGEADETRTARVTAFTKQQTEAKLALAQADLRATAAARALAAAEIELEASIAGTTTATATSTNVANANAARGFAQLGLAESRVVANVALTAATVELAAAETGLAASEVRLSVAQTASIALGKAATSVMQGLKAAALATSSALGGPVVIALTVVAGALIYMAGQTNAALDALHNFAGGQEELERRLGITTAKLNEQSKAARDLALALAQTNVIKARTARTDSNADLGASLETLATQIAPGVGGRLGAALGNGQSASDAQALFAVAGQLKAGQAISAKGISTVTALLAKYPQAAKDTGLDGVLNRFAGRGASATPDKILGVEASRLTLKDALATLDEVKTELAKPRVIKPPVKPLTAAQIVAQGTAGAAKLEDPKNKALDTLEDAKKRILGDKNKTDQEKVDDIAEATAAYRVQLASIDKRDAAAARGIARKAEAEHKKELREAAKAARELELANTRAAAATEKLADARSKYDDAPRLVDQVRNDQRAFQAMVGTNINATGPDGKVTRRAYTQEEATADQARAQTALNKPFADMTREMERQQQIQVLTAQGRNAEADALGRSFQLLDRTGELQDGQYASLLRAAEGQESINAAIAERGRIVSTLSGTVDTLRDDVSTFLGELNQGAGKASVNFGRNLVSGFAGASRKLFVDNLFGGAQKKIDDLISGKTGLDNATTFTAMQTQRTGGIVRRFGDVVAEVSTSVENVIAKLNNGGTTSGELAGAASLPAAFQNAKLGESLSQAIDTNLNVFRDDPRILQSLGLGADRVSDTDPDILVTASRIAKAEADGKAGSTKPPSLREVYNETGRSIGAKLDEALGTKFGKTIGSKLGNVLQGAATGSTAAGIFGSVFGGKQSAAGGQLGGAIGGALSSITAITSALGPFGAALSPVLGIAGSLVGGLFKKTKQASSTLSFNATSGELTGTAGVGSGKEEKAAATQLGGALASQLSSIAEQLGGTIGGAGSVSIGYRPGHKAGAFRVDTSGQGKLTGVEAFDTEEEAIAAALKDAITDGVITGISQASQNILKSGQDLQKALEKALLIESIPKRLLAIQNPVKAAITDLNTEFSKIISALNEGKGTAQQYADAQKLYDLERAQALKDAQKSATSAIDAYLKNMTAGSASPLNKATVYENASSDLNKIAADVRGGKVVDEDALLDAAQKFQDASRALNGSSGSFFNDFDMLKSLLEQAKSNVGGVGSDTALTDLPESPFSSAAVQAAISNGSSATVKATTDQTQVLSDKLDSLIDAVNANGGGVASTGGTGYSSLDNLAAFRTALT